MASRGQKVRLNDWKAPGGLTSLVINTDAGGITETTEDNHDSIEPKTQTEKSDRWYTGGIYRVVTIHPTSFRPGTLP